MAVETVDRRRWELLGVLSLSVGLIWLAAWLCLQFFHTKGYLTLGQTITFNGHFAISDFLFKPTVFALLSFTIVALLWGIGSTSWLLRQRDWYLIPLLTVLISTIALIVNASITGKSNVNGSVAYMIAPALTGALVVLAAIAINFALLRKTRTTVVIWIMSIDCLIGLAISSYCIFLGLKDSSCVRGWLPVNTTMWSARLIYLNTITQGVIAIWLLSKNLSVKDVPLGIACILTLVMFLWGMYAWQIQLEPRWTDYVGSCPAMWQLFSWPFKPHVVSWWSRFPFGVY